VFVSLFLLSWIYRILYMQWVSINFLYSFLCPNCVIFSSLVSRSLFMMDSFCLTWLKSLSISFLSGVAHCSWTSFTCKYFLLWELVMGIWGKNSEFILIYQIQNCYHFNHIVDCFILIKCIYHALIMSIHPSSSFSCPFLIIPFPPSNPSYLYF
jgi:hypothetical protein